MNRKFQRQILKIKKEWGWVLLWGVAIVILFFLLRLTNLTLLPVFADEAIYIRWAQVMRAEPTLRFLPLSDGKQPLFMWLTIPFLKFLADPLLAGRLLSVFSGLGSLIGLFLLTNELLKKKDVSLLAAFFYAVVPFFVFFDRMALVDALLLAFAVWTAYLGVLLARSLRLDLAMITGMFLGGALITKSPAVFFAILLPFSLFLSRKKKATKENLPLYLIKVLGLGLVVYVFAFSIYNLLRLGPNFHLIAIRNKDYVFSLREAWQHPFDPFQFHLREIFFWFGNLLTWPIFLAGFGGIILGLRKHFRVTLFLLLWTLFPLLVEAELAKVFTPRYLLFTAWPWLILAALTAAGLIDSLKTVSRKAWFLVLILLTANCLWYDFFLLTRPAAAPLPRKMRSGYLEEWTAGQGIREIADLIKKKAEKTSVFVGTEGFFGTLPDGLQIYLEKVPRVTVVGVGYPISGVPESLINSLADNEVYLVVNQSRLQIPPNAYGLELVKAYPKAVNPEGKQDRLLLFKVKKEFWSNQ